MLQRKIKPERGIGCLEWRWRILDRDGGREGLIGRWALSTGTGRQVRG